MVKTLFHKLDNRHSDTLFKILNDMILDTLRFVIFNLNYQIPNRNDPNTV